MGWTWDYTAKNVGFYRLQELTRYWKKYPPLHQMVATHWGFLQKQGEDIRAQTHLPVNSVTATEFESLLKQHGLTP
jgi:hypothetical protein